MWGKCEMNWFDFQALLCVLFCASSAGTGRLPVESTSTPQPRIKVNGCEELWVALSGSPGWAIKFPRLRELAVSPLHDVLTWFFDSFFFCLCIYSEGLKSVRSMLRLFSLTVADRKASSLESLQILPSPFSAFYLNHKLSVFLFL